MTARRHIATIDLSAENCDLVDVLLTPAGGNFTIDAAVAAETGNKLTPKVVIPMHYRTAKCGYPIVDAEVSLRGRSNVKRLDATLVREFLCVQPGTWVTGTFYRQGGAALPWKETCAMKERLRQSMPFERQEFLDRLTVEGLRIIVQAMAIFQRVIAELQAHHAKANAS